MLVETNLFLAQISARNYDVSSLLRQELGSLVTESTVSSCKIILFDILFLTSAGKFDNFENDTCYQDYLPVQPLIDVTEPHGDGLAYVQGDHQGEDDADEGEDRVQNSFP